ncbi:MAG: DUF72 domain-containing protein [Actinobacteria bacterium]|nr:DUF72 domain-containing protein [Actinomycetota bacterium]
MERKGGKVLVGISSWTEPTLIKRGNFYPKGATSAEDRLRFYASRFPIVEVDSTYYFPPSERNSVLWIERTPKDFTFNIKAYSLLTNHPTKVDSLYKDVKEALPKAVAAKRNVYRDTVPPELLDETWARFREALMPLHSAGKLGAVLFQFPQWFVISRASKDYLLECAERLPDYRVAVEFRHKSWMEERNRRETLSFLETHRLPYVCVDMPQGFASSLPPVAAATCEDLAMVRFHGRDPVIWEKKTQTAAERFRYDYDERELGEWMPRIEALAGQVRETHVVLNNCYENYAVKNARQLASLLE